MNSGKINRAVFTIVLILSFSCLPDFRGYYGGINGEQLLAYLEDDALKDLIENQGDPPLIRILDVRSPAEYAAGHIPSAESYPADQIASLLDELQPETLYIVYCHTGIRAQTVIVNVFEKNGYEGYMNWGGIDNWGYDLE